MVPAAGGLTFDSDIDQVFDAQKATVVNGSVVTPSARVEVPAPRPMTDEEAFIKGVKTGEVSQQDYAAAAKNELSAKNRQERSGQTRRQAERKRFQQILCRGSRRHAA